MPTAVPGLVRSRQAGIGQGLRIAAGGAGGARDFRQTEIENLGVAAIGDENVGGLDVAVDDSLAVRGIERIGYFDRQGEQAFELHRLAVNQMFQGLAAETLHHDEQMSVVLADFVDGADVGMIQRRRGARLAAKAFESLRILRGIVGKKFQSDEAAELSVFRFVDDTHPSAAKKFEDAVMGDSLADHGRVNAGLGSRASRNPRYLRRIAGVRQREARARGQGKPGQR